MATILNLTILYYIYFLTKLPQTQIFIYTAATKSRRVADFILSLLDEERTSEQQQGLRQRSSSSRKRSRSIRRTRRNSRKYCIV